jgi:Protein ENHANCED DISEASE RESISTANCE 2, C-terminal
MSSSYSLPSPTFHFSFTNLTGTMATIPPPILSPESWSDIDASTFRIRGRTYNQDKVKAASAPSIFKLIAIDVSTVRTQYKRTTVSVSQPAVQFLHFSSPIKIASSPSIAFR